MMNGTSPSRSLNIQPTRLRGAATEFRGLSTDRNTLAQTLPRSMTRAASINLAALEQSILRRINQQRQQRGLSTLSSNSTIAQQARQHSQAMANSRNLSHSGFNGRVQTIRASIPLRSAAENVAFNQGFSDPVAQTVNGWLRSPGHLRNIMGNFNLTGVGVARNNQGEFYFTQIFIQR